MLILFVSSFALVATPFVYAVPQGSLTITEFGASSDFFTLTSDSDSEWVAPIGTGKGGSETTFLLNEFETFTATFTVGNSEVTQILSGTGSATLVVSASGFQITESADVLECHATASDSGACAFLEVENGVTSTLGTATGHAIPQVTYSISTSGTQALTTGSSGSITSVLSGSTTRASGSSPSDVLGASTSGVNVITTASSGSASPTHSGALGRNFECGMFRVILSGMILGGLLVL